MTPRPDEQEQGSGPTRPGTPSAEQARLAGLVLLTLRSVAPAEVLGRLSALLARELDAREVQLYLSDYQMTGLQLIPATPAAQDADPEPLDDSPLGGVFLTQRPLVRPAAGDRQAVAVPVTVRGQRLGVLRALLTVGSSPVATGPAVGLQTAADVLAHVVVEASTGSDVFEVTRRSARFTVAAELQRQLLPGRAVATPGYTLSGQVEPAPYVQGDAFDWSADPGLLTLCAVHVDGRGQSAALLSTLTVTALRNARRAQVGLVDQARLADQAVYAQYGGDRSASALLMSIDSSGRALVVDAGSPALLRWRGDAGQRVSLDAQLPLGMFEDTPYVAQELGLEPGDRLLIATPGALEAVSPAGVAFGEDGLLDQLGRTRDLPPQEVTRRLVAALVAHQGQALSSDASVLCLDWRGR